MFDWERARSAAALFCFCGRVGHWACSLETLESSPKNSGIYFRHTDAGLALTPRRRSAPILGSPLTCDRMVSLQWGRPCGRSW